MKKRLSSVICAGVMTSLVSGCQHQPSTPSYSRISNVNIVSDKTFSVSGLRHIALRDAALSLGARGGLAYRASEIRSEIYAHESMLDRIFNFNGLVLDDNVIPPVLVEGRQTLDQTQDDIIRLSDRSYIILLQARFATAPPSWRDYLKMEYHEPELPDRSLLPRNETEKKVWENYIHEGWEAGILQANSIFLENLGRLKRDYEGMVRYHTLLAQGIVTKPFVARVELGITGDDEKMSVNDRVLRITAKPAFELKGEKWNPELVKKKPEPKCEEVGRYG